MAHKIERINELIRQELGKIILEEEEMEPGILATIMAVDCSQDLRHSNITLSVFPSEKGPTILKRLDSHIFNLQQKLNKKLKMNPVPKIRFILTLAESESQKIDALIEKTKYENNKT